MFSQITQSRYITAIMPKRHQRVFLVSRRLRFARCLAVSFEMGLSADLISLFSCSIRCVIYKTKLFRGRRSQRHQKNVIVTKVQKKLLARNIHIINERETVPVRRKCYSMAGGMSGVWGDRMRRFEGIRLLAREPMFLAKASGCERYVSRTMPRGASDRVIGIPRR